MSAVDITVVAPLLREDTRVVDVPCLRVRPRYRVYSCQEVVISREELLVMSALEAYRRITK